MKRRIGIVNQRYGPDVNGGSEYYTRMIAEKLKDRYDIEIITTTARDYDTWQNSYPEGTENVNGIPVRRFRVRKKRGPGFRIMNKLMRLEKFCPVLLDRLWIRAQGPYCPDAVRYLREHRNDYDVVLFVTYLYYLTVCGLPEVGKKAILVPTAHDEFCIHFELYREIFQKPGAIIYLTEEEKRFVNGLFHNENVPDQVMGVGVDLPDHVDSGRFRKKYGITDDYVIYVGRVDKAKNCHQMFQYFQYYKTLPGSSRTLKLVVLGRVMMETVPDDDIRLLGFVEEEDKFDAISGARALLLPSEYESLSIAVLEAMALGRPVIVNEKSAVLRQHCDASGAGIACEGKEDFAQALRVVSADTPEYLRMCGNGKPYIEKNYRWEDILPRYEAVIESVAEQKGMDPEQEKRKGKSVAEKRTEQNGRKKESRVCGGKGNRTERGKRKSCLWRKRKQNGRKKERMKKNGKGRSERKTDDDDKGNLRVPRDDLQSGAPGSEGEI